MAQAYTVYWARAAIADLEAIIEHIHAENPLAARQWLDRFRALAESLNVFPERGRLVPELEAQGITHYRELIEPPWRLLYRIDQQQVHVMLLIDARRNVEDVLLERLTRQP